MGCAALDLLLERGLGGGTVDEIAARAGVTRRTFSRHFVDRADAVLECIRMDGHRINDAMRARPGGESPLTAYACAVADWYGVIDAEDWAGLDRRRRHTLFRRIDTESALFAAFQRIRVDAEAESIDIVADRLGVDPAADPRPAVAVGAGAGTLTAALTAWSRGDDPDALLAQLNAHFESLGALLPPDSPTLRPGKDEIL